MGELINNEKALNAKKSFGKNFRKFLKFFGEYDCVVYKTEKHCKFVD